MIPLFSISGKISAAFPINPIDKAVRFFLQFSTSVRASVKEESLISQYPSFIRLSILDSSISIQSATAPLKVAASG